MKPRRELVYTAEYLERERSFFGAGWGGGGGEGGKRRGEGVMLIIELDLEIHPLSFTSSARCNGPVI